jgi:hypothetical protein
MEVDRDGHRARRHALGAAQPRPRKEHVGDRSQRREIQRTRRIVSHPEPRQTVALGTVLLTRQDAVHKSHLVAGQPLGGLEQRRHALHLGSSPDLGHGHIADAPGLTAYRRHGRGRGHDLRLALGIGLGDGQQPVLGGAVGTHRVGVDLESARPHGCRIVDGDGQRIAQALRVLLNGLHQAGRRDAAIRADHIPVIGRSRSLVLIGHARSAQRHGTIKGWRSVLMIGSVAQGRE